MEDEVSVVWHDEPYEQTELVNVLALYLSIQVAKLASYDRSYPISVELPILLPDFPLCDTPAQKMTILSYYIFLAMCEPALLQTMGNKVTSSFLSYYATVKLIHTPMNVLPN